MSLLADAVSPTQGSRKQKVNIIVPKEQKRDLAEVIDLDSLRKQQLDSTETSELRNLLGQELAKLPSPFEAALNIFNQQQETAGFAGVEQRDTTSALLATLLGSGALTDSGNKNPVGATGAGPASAKGSESLGPGQASTVPNLAPLPGGLTSVVPVAQLAAREIITLFKNPYGIGGVGARSNKSDHPSGRAIDVMTGGSSNTPASGAGLTRGNSIVQHMLSNWGRLNVKYIIWNGRLWNSPTSSRPFRGSGGDGYGGAHGDHVHISFRG